MHHRVVTIQGTTDCMCPSVEQKTSTEEEGKVSSLDCAISDENQWQHLPGISVFSSMDAKGLGYAFLFNPHTNSAEVLLAPFFIGGGHQEIDIQQLSQVTQLHGQGTEAVKGPEGKKKAGTDVKIIYQLQPQISQLTSRLLSDKKNFSARNILHC